MRTRLRSKIEKSAWHILSICLVSDIICTVIPCAIVLTFGASPWLVPFIGLFIYLFLSLGLPKILSIYSCCILKADVTIGHLDLFRREFIDIRYLKDNKDVHIKNLKIKVNILEIITKSKWAMEISGLEAKILYLPVILKDPFYVHMEGKTFITMTLSKTVPETTQSAVFDILCTILRTAKFNVTASTNSNFSYHR